MGAQAGRRRGPELPALRASPVKGLLCGVGWRAALRDNRLGWTEDEGEARKNAQSRAIAP